MIRFVALTFLLTLGSAVWAVPKEKVVTIDDIVLDRPYPAMTGPNKYTFMSLHDSTEPQEVWILGSKIEIVDMKSGAPVPEALCHSRLGLARVDGLDLKALDIVKDNPKLDMEHFLSLSQGQFEMNFPSGFGLKLQTSPQRDILLGAQFQREPGAKKNQHTLLRTKFSVRYADAETARKDGLKPLYSFIMPVFTEGNSRHWHVPPGKHTYRTKIRLRSAQNEVLKAHYIRVHLHAYATSVELFDLTAGQRVWRANARTDRKVGALSHTDYFSSAEGLILHPNHIFEVRAEYDNPLKKPVDAMAFLNLYLDSPSAMADFRPNRGSF